MTTTALPAEDGLVQFPTTIPGNYSLFSDSDEISCRFDYSVNVAESESHNRRITLETVKSKLPAGKVLISDKADFVAANQESTPDGGQLLVPLALVLLALLYAESLYSNRFYDTTKKTFTFKKPLF